MLSLSVIFLLNRTFVTGRESREDIEKRRHIDMGIRKTAYAMLFTALTLLGGAGAAWREEDLSPEAAVIIQDGAAYGEEAPAEDTEDTQNLQIIVMAENSLKDEKKAVKTDSGKSSEAEKKKGNTSATEKKTTGYITSDTEGGNAPAKAPSGTVSGAAETVQETPLRPAGKQTEESVNTQQATEKVPEKAAESPAHVHEWQTETICHEEQSHNVHHDAVTEQRWVSVPVTTVTYCCDVCGAEFASQDAAYAHENATYKSAMESGDMSLIHSGHYSRTVTED